MDAAPVASRTSEIPRIVTPLAIAAAILVSFRAGSSSGPVELAPGDAPPPSVAEARAAIATALAPGGPGYDRGSTRAAVTVLEFADFGCPYCAQFAAATYPRLAREFVATGLVRWKYVPFVMGIFSNGDQAARAGDCAGQQGRTAFSRMHDQLYGLQDEWKGAGDAQVAFRSLAAPAGLDLKRYDACWASDEPDARIRASSALADRLGVHATPTFFVNEQRVEGALPLPEFRALLLEALGRSRGDARLR